MQDTEQYLSLIGHKKPTNKAPPNKESLDSLKAQGFRVIVTHYRKTNFFVNGWNNQDLVPDKKWRAIKNDMIESCGVEIGRIYNPSELGGATELILESGEEKIVVRAYCYYKDRFCRRIGVKAALEKLERMYGIKA